MRKGLEEFSLLLRRWVITVGWMGLMLYASTDVASGNHTGLALHHFLADLGLHLSDQTIATINFFIRKGAHVTEFAILAILLWRDGEPVMRSLRQPFDFRLAGIVLGICVVFAALSETVQRFFPSREPSIRDVIINTGGATLGLFILYLIRRKNYRKPPKKAAKTVLFTSDLHLDLEHSPLVQLKAALARTRPGVCVVVGDIGTADRAAEWLAELKEATAGTPLVICLGNHDHWLKRERHAECPGLTEVREKIWRPALEAAGIPCLDLGNAEFDDLVIVGGYGHFDLGMRVRDLELGGQTATLENYHRGEFAGLISNDMKYQPNAAASLAEEAQVQAKALAARLAQAVATGKRVVVATHTVPFASLNGHADDTTKPTRFLHAYSGNTLVGDVLSAQRGKIELAVCGHTHAHVPLKVINGIPCINIGSDYEALGFVLFEVARPGTAAQFFRVDQR